MVRPSRKRKAPAEFNYLENKDRRMRFNNSKDPIYYVFDCIENRPVSNNLCDFNLFSFLNFLVRFGI